MRLAFCLALALPIAACSATPEASGNAAMIERDPLVARALHDPLMSDPDLSARNMANALVGFADQTALPLLPATPDAARAAREAGRLELLEDGDIPALPAPSLGAEALPGAGAGAGELLAAMGAPESCTTALAEGFDWAAGLPPVAAIMPQGMVVQAGGAKAAPCKLRIIRYRTSASATDVLEYHHARAVRAGLAASYRADAPAGLTARANSGEALVVAVRENMPGGLTAVDLLYRAR